MLLHLGGCLGCHSDAEPVTPGVAMVNGFVNALAMMTMDRTQAAAYFANLCAEHRHAAIACVDALARANKRPFRVLFRAIFETCGTPLPES